MGGVNTNINTYRLNVEQHTQFDAMRFIYSTHVLQTGSQNIHSRIRYAEPTKNMHMFIGVGCGMQSNPLDYCI